MKRINILFALGFGLAISVSMGLYKLWTDQQTAYQRVLQASESLQLDLDTLRGENGQLIAQNRALSLKSEELTHLLPNLSDEIRKLEVRISRTQSVSVTSFQAKTSPTVAIRDSMIYDTLHVRKFDYEDGYFRIEGTEYSNQQHLELSYQDTLVQVVYRGERERPWLWIFSPRKLMQRVSLKNPNANIYYSQNIQIVD